MSYWRNLSCEECCYTCKNNKNHLKENESCSCNIKVENKSQSVWCSKYDMCYEEED